MNIPGLISRFKIWTAHIVAYVHVQENIGYFSLAIIKEMMAKHPMSRDQIAHLVSKEQMGSSRKGVLSYLAGQMRKAARQEHKGKTIDQLLETVRAEAKAELEQTALLAKAKIKLEQNALSAARVDKRNKIHGGPGRQDPRSHTNGGKGRKDRQDTRKRRRPNKDEQSTDKTTGTVEQSGAPAAKKHKSSPPSAEVTGEVISTPVSGGAVFEGVLNAPVNPDKLVGMWIKKNFENYGDFEGQIISHDVDMSGKTIYRIKYRDDDEEDLFLDEVIPLIQKVRAISK